MSSSINVTVGSAAAESETATNLFDGVPEVDANGAAGKESAGFRSFKSINVDVSRNPRRPEAYSQDNLDWLARNIFEHGLEKALVLAERLDGTLWLVEGHLRYHAIKLVREKGLLKVVKRGDQTEKAAVPPQPDFCDKVKVIIIKGMTEIDELSRLMDHGTTTPLNRRELYEACKIMKLKGFKQQLIGDKLGISRSSASKFIWVFQMPKVVEDMFYAGEAETVKGVEKEPKLSDATINTFNVAYNADIDAGSPIKTVGPKLAVEIEKFVKAGKTPQLRSLTRDTLRDMAKNFTDPGIHDVLHAISDGNEQAATVAINRLVLRMEQESRHLYQHNVETDGPVPTVTSEAGVTTPIGEVERID